MENKTQQMLSEELYKEVPNDVLRARTSSIHDNEKGQALKSFDEINNSEVIDLPEELGVEEKHNNKMLGYFYAIIAGFLFALMIVCWKIAYSNNPALTGIDYLLIRSISMTGLGIGQVSYIRLNVFDVKKGYRLLLLLRVLAGAIGMPCYFIGLKYVPATKGSLIFNIHPILVAIAAYFLLKEALSLSKVFAAVGAFLGVILLTLGKNDSNESSEYYYFGIAFVSWTCIWITIVSILLRIVNQHIHYALSPFWFTFATLIEAMLILIFIPSLYNFSHYTWFDCGMFVLSGLFNYTAQNLKSLAFKYGDASAVTSLGYFQVIYLLLADLFIFNYSFSITDISGALIITSCLIGPIFYEMYVQKTNKSATK